MFEQIDEKNEKSAANENQFAVTRATEDQAMKTADAAVGLLRTISDLTFVVLMTVIVIAHPLWALLLTHFVYS